MNACSQRLKSTQDRLLTFLESLAGCASSAFHATGFLHRIKEIIWHFYNQQKNRLDGYLKQREMIQSEEYQRIEHHNSLTMNSHSGGTIISFGK